MKSLMTIVTIVMVLTLSVVMVAPAYAVFSYDGSGDLEAAGFAFSTNIPGDTGPSDPLAWDFDTESGSPQPGILYQDSTPFSGGGVSASDYTLDETTAAAELVNANGWMVEFRTQSLQNTGDRFGNFLAVGDEVGGIGILLNPDNYEFYDATFAGYPGNIDLHVTGLSSDYHTTLLTVAPGGTSVDVSIDGVPQGSVPFGGSNPPRLLFGDGSSGSAGESNWDFININVPEPTTLLLLGTGLAGLVTLRRRTH